jgi:2-amino-4-hydroxy-6-hydroxymethyldihydropteridine diphosphokinase
MIEAYIGLGSNVGDRMGYLRAALDRLAREPAFVLRKHSRAWETEPIGPPQARFLNAVALIGTVVSARATLRKLLEIEELVGRIRREKWGPREIDLDLLLFGERIVSEGALRVPHPHLQERAFALGPLVELAPDVVHPVLLRPAAELYAGLPPEELQGVRPLGPIRRFAEEAGTPPDPAEGTGGTGG